MSLFLVKQRRMVVGCSLSFSINPVKQLRESTPLRWKHWRIEWVNVTRGHIRNTAGFYYDSFLIKVFGSKTNQVVLEDISYVTYRLLYTLCCISYATYDLFWYKFWITFNIRFVKCAHIWLLVKLLSYLTKGILKTTRFGSSLWYEKTVYLIPLRGLLDRKHADDHQINVPKRPPVSRTEVNSGPRQSVYM